MNKFEEDLGHFASQETSSREYKRLLSFIGEINTIAKLLGARRPKTQWLLISGIIGFAVKRHGLVIVPKDRILDAIVVVSTRFRSYCA